MKIHLSMSIEWLEKELKSFGNKEDWIDKTEDWYIEKSWEDVEKGILRIINWR